MQGSEVLSLSPSFNSYTYDRLSEIAAKVMEDHDRDAKLSADDGDSFGDDDFEFAFVRSGFDVETEDIFHDGDLFPVLNSDLLIRDDDDDDDTKPDVKTLRLPLKKLFIMDREEGDPSSEKGDELEGVTPGTYCVWRPKKRVVNDDSPSPSRCKKSNSTGSAPKKRPWKLRDLISRSNSEGKESFMFWTPKKE